MTRTHAEALALVNWRGVFYERYLLDRRVTALEGVNGAGKTTVMVAAYVTLLPDMSRLRFTTLGETGATGGDKGIWGRLGDPGRPSYAVMDFAIAGEQRLIAGVHLERKGEPSVEPTPFIIWGLAKTIRLQELLLVMQRSTEAVPELSELRENAARLGGRLQSFTSAREYLATLFDQGVTPLRLGTDEERNKFNEMLRTSMTGGISRVLTSELRSFVLREENGLADTLQRMRANLDACRRTRTEVQESHRLEQEISGILDAGQIMFAAAFLATRERAEELLRRVTEAQAERDQAHQTQEAAQEALDSVLADLDALTQRRNEIDHVLASARERHTQLETALAALHTLAQASARLAQTESVEREMRAQRDAAEERKTRSQEACQRARDGYTRAAQGLADLQQGIDELHRRAGAYRQATLRLREAETQLQIKALPPQFAGNLASAHAALDKVDRERRTLRVRVADADAHRTRHAELMRSLQRIAGRDVDISSAHQAATEALHHYRQQHALAERLPGIKNDLAEARRAQARQLQAYQRGCELGVVHNEVPNETPAAEIVGHLLAEAEAKRSENEAAESAAREALATVQIQREEAVKQHQHLLALEPQWQEHAARAARLSEYLGRAVDDEATLEAARQQLRRQHTDAQKASEQAQEACERLIQEARDLLDAGGPFSAALLRVKDQLGADLLAGCFEELPIEEAAVLEARLGALAQALIVDDPAAAARSLAERPDELANVLLVPHDTDLQHLTESSDNMVRGHDITVYEGDVLRISRIPAKPRLGRRARERRAAELRAQADTKALELDTARGERRRLEQLIADGDALLAGSAVWRAGDPTTAIRASQAAISLADDQIAQYRHAMGHHAQASRTLLPRIDGLRRLLAEATLLDPPDYTERVGTLEEEALQAGKARDWAANKTQDASRLEDGLADLRMLPLSDGDLAALRLRAQALEDRRMHLDAGIEALEYLCTHAEALSWQDAPRRLEAEQALIPALRDQLDEAQALQSAAEGTADQAQADYGNANADFLAADRQYSEAKQSHMEATAAFDPWKNTDPTEEALAAIAGDIERAQEEFLAHGARRETLLHTQGRCENELQNAQRSFRAADEKLASERREADPARKRWEALLERARSKGLVGDLTTRTPKELTHVRGHINFVQEAKTQQEILLERLSKARGGDNLLAGLPLTRPGDAAFADAFLDLWLAVRDWLYRRLPAQVAEVADPREALARLRDQLDDLEARLSRQERELRGASEDVARGIEVQIRRARGQVNRLTRSLETVSFGGIQSIRVRMLPVDRMEQVLSALRNGAAQELLFQADMPIEEALDEIFRRYGGTRSGGQRLLDYREYVQLQVEVRRKSSPAWEVANPTRLSTGEAIGVGAALMMVVLTEWERDATLLRGKRTHGSLRFLFLDEANRLSPDNLGVLFDLCQTLDLQLMIAAPEVARAEGNTTYRLVRRPTADGRGEEVLVSGRRARGAG